MAGNELVLIQQQHIQLLNKARELLAQAQTIEQTLKVRTVAITSEAFFRTAKDSGQLAFDAGELRLRAERKAGELLIEMAEKGDRQAVPEKGGSSSSQELPSLSDLGVDKKESYRWQNIARVPESNFEEYIRISSERRKELPYAPLLKEAKEQKKEEEKAKLAEKIESEAGLYPKGPFRVLVIDPPWRYESRSQDITHRGRVQYPDMSVDEICALPVADLAHADSVLWLWTTNSFLREAFLCLDAWNFEYKSALTWVKNRIGLGDWLRGQTEHCFMAARGRPVIMLSNQSTALLAEAREHSRKPEEFYWLVEDLCPGNKVEFFARSNRAGWQSWGAETNRFE